MIYSLKTGELIKYPHLQTCTLVYYNDEFEFAVPSLCPHEWKETYIQVEIYKISGIKNILKHYVNNMNTPDYSKYSHFFVFYANICDVYIPGRKFLAYYNIIDIDDYDDKRYNFFLLRLRYHRKMFMFAIDRFAHEEYAEVDEIINVEHKECYNYIDINSLSVINTVDGGNILGVDQKWECSNLAECAECNIF